MEYLLLPHPGFARLFPENAGAALRAELCALLGAAEEPVRASVAGAEGWLLSCGELTEGALSALARSAAFYALFAREGELLRPVAPPAWRLLPDTLPALLKYSGKTSERFTRWLCNLALGARRGGETRRPVLLDPMCGQGTALFEGAVRGWDAVGLEILEPPANKGTDYFVRFLETGRYKHKRTQEKRSAEGKRIARLTEVRWAARREDWETPETRSLRVFCADARDASRLLPKKAADLLVCDLPYGVQHGGRDGGGYRDVAPLLADCLPALAPALRPGAGVAVSYNTLTARRDRLCAAMAERGFAVDAGLSGGALCHRVDQAITRDVIVATYL